MLPVYSNEPAGWGEAYLIPTWLMQEHRLAHVQINQSMLPVLGVHTGRLELPHPGQYHCRLCECGGHRRCCLPHGPPRPTPITHSQSCWHGHIPHQHFGRQVFAS